LLYGFVNYI
nr:Chain C, HuD (G2L) peptide [synthetic construct]3PWN_F Chain F, HuD (G2L) peptide [synthetic construct]